MKKRSLILWSVVCLFVSDGFCGDAGSSPVEVVPTFADAAVILAKFSGLFDSYVSKDASLNDCVSFFNKHGVYFGLMEVVNGSEFKKSDCARVMGQIELLMSGEAEYSMGKVMLPKGIDSWTDFCSMNDVQYVQGYEHIVNGMVAVHRLGN